MRWLFLLDLLLAPAVLLRLRALFGLLRPEPELPLAEAGADSPLVSVLVPARNEARGIEDCLRAVLAQRYPRLEVVATDDCSTDRTGAILEQLAREDARLTALRGLPKPVDWDGKCWTLHQAVGWAHGEWLLFLDADARARPELVASLMALAVDRELDLLSLMGEHLLGSFWERCLMPGLLAVCGAGVGSVAEANASRLPVARAWGPCILMRRSAYEALGGHEAVKSFIGLEDVALARLAKERGCRLHFTGGRRVISVRLYRSLGEIWHGLVKGAYPASRRYRGGLARAVLAPPIAVMAPPLVLGWFIGRRRSRRPLETVEWLLLLKNIGQGLLLLGFSVRYVGRYGLHPLWGLTVPIGIAFWSPITAYSGFRVLSGRGLTWRGRTY